MTNKELRSLTLPKLEKTIQDFRGQLFVVRFEIHAGQKTNYSAISKLRHNIARGLTILNEKKSIMSTANLSKSKPIIKSILKPKKLKN